MNKGEVLTVIETSLNQILDAKGAPRVALTEGSAFLDDGTGVDSLDLAQVVLELQTLTGSDPFQTGFVEFHTAGELADLFAA